LTKLKITNSKITIARPIEMPFNIHISTLLFFLFWKKEGNHRLGLPSFLL